MLEIEVYRFFEEMVEIKGNQSLLCVVKEELQIQIEIDFNVPLYYTD